MWMKQNFTNSSFENGNTGQEIIEINIIGVIAM